MLRILYSLSCMNSPQHFPSELALLTLVLKKTTVVVIARASIVQRLYARSEGSSVTVLVSIKPSLLAYNKVWQSKTQFLAIFDWRSTIVKSVFDCRLPGVSTVHDGQNQQMAFSHETEHVACRQLVRNSLSRYLAT